MMPSLLEQLAQELEAKTKKTTKKDVAKFVLDVDGKLQSQRPTNKSELKEAIVAIKIAKPTAKIYVYKLEGAVDIKLPVSGAAVEGE